MLHGKAGLQAAAKLADRIDQLITANPDDFSITLLAHSMGELVSRYYLESGKFTTRPGFKSITKLITLGTPHFGAAKALPLVLASEKYVLLSAAQVQLLASDPRYSGPYELLPPRSVPYVWDDQTSDIVPYDVFDAEKAAAIGFAPENLRAAQEFHKGLDFARKPDSVRYFCFSGTRHKTIAYMRVRKGAGNSLRVVRDEQPESGDGTVANWSSLLPVQQWLYVGGMHAEMFKDDGLRKLLARLLGREGVLAVGAPMQLSIRDKVVEPKSDVLVALVFPKRSASLDGTMKIEKIQVAGDGKSTVTSAVKSYAIKYTGVAIKSFSNVLEAPDMPGFYRVAFYSGQAAQAEASDEFVVQQSAP